MSNLAAPSSSPQIGTFLRHDRSIHHEQTAPGDDAPIVQIVVADDRERRFVAALRLRVNHLARLRQTAQRILPVLETHRHRARAPRPPEEVVIMPVPPPLVELRDRPMQSIGRLRLDHRIGSPAARVPSPGKRRAQRERLRLPEFKGRVERHRQRVHFRQLPVIILHSRRPRLQTAGRAEDKKKNHQCTQRHVRNRTGEAQKCQRAPSRSARARARRSFVSLSSRV